MPSTFTNQPVCQPIGTDVFGEDILLLVDKTGLASKYAGQAVTFDIWPAPFALIHLNITTFSVKGGRPDVKGHSLPSIFTYKTCFVDQ